MKWYKRDPDAALVGMQGLTDIEYRAYNVLIDLLYSFDGNVPDDDRFLCRHIGWRPQRWRKARAGLLAKGKIRLMPDGLLMANRVETELKTAHKLIENMRVLGRVSSEKRKEINEALQRNRWLQPQPERKKEGFFRKESTGTYSNGRCLGNGKASSIEDTLK